MKWSKNNLAATATWMALFIHDQTEEPFSDSSNVTIGSFPLWNALDSDDLREVRSRTFAVKLDKFFTKVERAKYEDGKTQTASVEGLTEILKENESTLLNLADKVDDFYFFPGEGSHGI